MLVLGTEYIESNQHVTSPIFFTTLVSDLLHKLVSVSKCFSAEGESPMTDSLWCLRKIIDPKWITLYYFILDTPHTQNIYSISLTEKEQSFSAFFNLQ